MAPNDEWSYKQFANHVLFLPFVSTLIGYVNSFCHLQPVNTIDADDVQSVDGASLTYDKIVNRMEVNTLL